MGMEKAPIRWLFFLLILASCTKETTGPRVAELLVESQGTYELTYGTSGNSSVCTLNSWSTTLNVNPGDKIHIAVKTTDSPATVYLRISMKDGLLYCDNLLIEPNSSGELNYIITP
jgi:hypothetical protein